MNSASSPTPSDPQVQQSPARAGLSLRALLKQLPDGMAVLERLIKQGKTRVVIGCRHSRRVFLSAIVRAGNVVSLSEPGDEAVLGRIVDVGGLTSDGTAPARLPKPTSH